MTSPADRKSVKVRPHVHRQLHELADDMGVSADHAIERLLNGVSVPLSAIQRQRWEACAAAAGLSLTEWVILRVEAAAEAGYDPGAMNLALDYLRSITAHFGVMLQKRPETCKSRNPEER